MVVYWTATLVTVVLLVRLIDFDERKPDLRAVFGVFFVEHGSRLHRLPLAVNRLLKDSFESAPSSKEPTQVQAVHHYNRSMNQS